eukprot:6213614-Pleurochrysis_carterae.AAC.7
MSLLLIRRTKYNILERGVTTIPHTKHAGTLPILPGESPRGSQRRCNISRGRARILLYVCSRPRCCRVADIGFMLLNVLSRHSTAIMHDEAATSAAADDLLRVWSSSRLFPGGDPKTCEMK